MRTLVVNLLTLLVLAIGLGPLAARGSDQSGSALENPPSGSRTTSTSSPMPSSAGMNGSNDRDDQAHEQIRLVTRHGEIVVDLRDNPTTRDLVRLLPLKVVFEDIQAEEKIGFLPRTLDTTGSPGSEASVGDLFYYAPWGNLGFYYAGGDDYSDDVVPLGTIRIGRQHVEELDQGPVTVERLPDGGPRSTQPTPRHSP